MKNMILIVDDNPKNLQLIGAVLNPYYQLLLANNGEKAIKTAELRMPDIILLDIMMPGMSGYEVCTKLKENDKTKNIPVIFLTAKTEESDISIAFDIGGVDYITKPFKIQEVLARIKTQIDLIESQRIQKGQNEELKKIIANRDKFFSIIAHDMKSPFQGFIGITELLCEEIAGFPNKELISLTKGLNANANNLYKLLSNLLDWARMQQDAISFNPIVILLSELVSVNIAQIIKRGEQKGINIINEIQQNQTVYADEAMLNSVLRNLLSNAVKFTNRGGEIKIYSKVTDDNMIEVAVKDNGIGMPEQLIKRLFKLEEKVGRNGTDGEGSSGLGLMLCKEFVEKNGGKIRVESQENLGSTYYFTLPQINKNKNL
jgi:two-component system, sensor histidine kinase and response regulator